MGNVPGAARYPPDPTFRPLFEDDVAKPKPISDIIQELWELLKAYARQETVDPLRSLGRYLGFGMGGATLLSVGVFFLALAGLRAMQTEAADTFDGAWSAVPYAIVALVLTGLAILAVSRISRGPHARHSDREEAR
jgi:hypothetical protein